MTDAIPPRQTRHPLWLIVVFNLVAVVLIVAALEYLASIFIEPPRRHIVDSFRFNHTWRPNSEKLHTPRWGNRKEWKSYTHRYNSQGWIEEYDIEISKPDNVYRIFFIGDSYTEGTVAMELSVPSEVETHFNQRAEEQGLDVRFEVINTGTSSYSPTIYYVLFRYAILEYSPDLIVVNLGMNDDYDDWKYRKTVIVDEEGNPVAVPPRDIYDSEYFEGRDSVVKATPWTRLQLFLSEHSYLYNFFLQYRKDRVRQSPDTTAKPEKGIYQKNTWMESDEWDEQTVHNVGYSLDLLRRLIRLAKSEGVKVMVSSVPNYHQYNTNEKRQKIRSIRPHQEIAKLSVEEGVPYLDLYQALYPKIKPSEQNYYYYKNDGHFNPRGYKIWSKAQIDFMLEEENRLLPESVYH